MPQPKRKEYTADFQLERTTDGGAGRYAEKTDDGSKGLVRTVYLRPELFADFGKSDEIEVVIRPKAKAKR